MIYDVLEDPLEARHQWATNNSREPQQWSANQQGGIIQKHLGRRVRVDRARKGRWSGVALSKHTFVAWQAIE